MWLYFQSNSPLCLCLPPTSEQRQEHPLMESKGKWRCQLSNLMTATWFLEEINLKENSSHGIMKSVAYLCQQQLLEYGNELIKSFSNSENIWHCASFQGIKLQSCHMNCIYVFLSVVPQLWGPMEFTLFTVNGCVQNLLEWAVLPSSEFCSFVFLSFKKPNPSCKQNPGRLLCSLIKNLCRRTPSGEAVGWREGWSKVVTVCGLWVCLCVK